MHNTLCIVTRYQHSISINDSVAVGPIRCVQRIVGKMDRNILAMEGVMNLSTLGLTLTLVGVMASTWTGKNLIRWMHNYTCAIETAMLAQTATGRPAMVDEAWNDNINRSRLQFAATIALVVIGLAVQLCGSLTK